MKHYELQPSELKIMNVIWDHHPISASEIASILMKETAWSKNTIYTLITRVVKKGFVKRTDPNFVCEPIITRKQIQQQETKSLVDRLYAGSLNMLFARIIEDENLSDAELDELRKLLDQKK